MKTLDKINNSKKFVITNILLVLLTLIVMFSPLILNKNAKFGATDDQSITLIAELNKNYKPWFQPLWEPPNEEIASMLFALQAALGAGFIGYFIGIRTRKNSS